MNTNWHRAHALVIGTAMAISLTALTSGAPAPRFYRMKRVQVIDKGGFAHPLPVLDLLVPADWTFAGGVKYENRGCFTDLAAITFHTESPDGQIAIEAFPSISWQFVDNPSVQRYLVMENQEGAKVGLKPCRVVRPVPAALVLQKVVVPLYRPGKEIAAMETSADLDKYVKERVQALQSQGASQGLQVRADEARARLKYDLNGKPVEEWILAISLAQSQPAAPGQNFNRYDCRAFMLLSMRAPQGQLEANEKLFNIVRASIQTEPEWQNEYLAIVNKLSAAQQQQRQIRDQIIHNFQQQEIATIQGVTANAQHGSDQSVATESQLLRGVETYRNPETGKQYELSNQYGNAWMNPNSDQVVLSEEANFSPGAALGGSWTPLEHVQAQP